MPWGIFQNFRGNQILGFSVSLFVRFLFYFVTIAMINSIEVSGKWNFVFFFLVEGRKWPKCWEDGKQQAHLQTKIKQRHLENGKKGHPGSLTYYPCLLPPLPPAPPTPAFMTFFPCYGKKQMQLKSARLKAKIMLWQQTETESKTRNLWA